MFKTIELRNFRVFDHITFDLTGPRDTPLSHAAVYGRNASGKTALVRSVEFLKATSISYGVMMNASSTVGEKWLDRTYAINGSLGSVCTDITVLAKRNMTRQPSGPMVLRFRFSVDGRDAEYTMTFSDSDQSLVSESLRFVSSKGRRILYYSVEKDAGHPKAVMNRDPFPESDFTSWLREQTEQWWGRQTLLSMIVYGASVRNRAYMEERSPNLMDLVDYMEGLNSAMSGLGGRTGDYIEANSFEGYIDTADIRVLEAYQRALDRFLTRLDPGLESVVYETSDQGNGRTWYGLTFNRLVAGRVMAIDYHDESSGVRKLVSLFPRLLGCASGRVAFIDEIDSGIHDKLVCDLLAQVLPDLGGQLVITTHNTSLLEELDPRRVFMLDVDMDGGRTIRPISDIARTCRNNNNRDRYMSGKLGAVPYIGTVDIRDIVEHLEEDLS